MHILGISGSLRAGSFNTRLLRVAANLMPGAELAIWDGLRAVPPFDEDDERDPAPAPVHALREAIAHADVILIATPEYNASLPGQLKNALDWASRPYATNVLRGKPVAVIAASPTRDGAAAAHADARRILARTARSSSTTIWPSARCTSASTPPVSSAIRACAGA